MKKHFIKALSLSALLAVQAIVSASCNKEDLGPALVPDPFEELQGALILNQGTPGAGNSCIDLVGTDNQLAERIFLAANGEKIGDTGRDIAVYGGKIYLSVFGSGYLAKLDMSGNLIEKYTFSQAEGQPRYLACKGGNVYVSLYSGQVAKFDTTSISKPQAFAKTGSRPESMALKGDSLLVANSSDSQQGISNNMLSVIDLSTFSAKDAIKLVDNLQQVEVVRDSVYVTYQKNDSSMGMINVDMKTGKKSEVSPATKIVAYGNYIFCANSAVVYKDTDSAAVVTNFYKHDIKNGQNSTVINFSGCEELKSAIVSLLEVNPYNGDIFVGTTDYNCVGHIYRFNRSGKLIADFDTSGLNPSSMVFLIW